MAPAAERYVALTLELAEAWSSGEPAVLAELLAEREGCLQDLGCSRISAEEARRLWEAEEACRRAMEAARRESLGVLGDLGAGRRGADGYSRSVRDRDSAWDAVG